MIDAWKEALWPSLEDWEPQELAEMRLANLDEIEEIHSTDWSTESELALEEAKRIAQEEEERRKTAESKASNLLLAAAALAPIFTSLESTVWDGKMGTAPKWISLPILAISVLYLCWGALWSLRALTAGNYVRVYQADLVGIWKNRRGIRRQLVSKTLSSTRLNQDTINKKISSVKMAHAFLFRAIVAFGMLILVQAFFEMWSVVSPHPSEVTRSTSPNKE